MAENGWRLSAFGDEISDDLQEQLTVLRALQIGFLELRGVWGKNVLHLDDGEVKAVARACTDQGIAVSAIGSPVGKSPITQPLAQELANLTRIFAIADALGTRLVRVFSFYPPQQNEVAWTEEALVEEASARLAAMSEAASAAGIDLVLENEHGIVGDTVARCRQLMDVVNSPRLGFAWDPANFVNVGETAAVTDGWASLGPRTRHVHIKDFRASTGEVLPAGEGDGQIDLLLQQLDRAGYNGFLALEPHLAFAGQSSGFSGPVGMQRAATALRSLMARVGTGEQLPPWAEGE
ncbi:MAG: sugar phosphate isomerase/epimerase [Caldilineaceae bacterium]|nr:sugar phosphate isomerase/epimerase [Caldilineaceae bacterium]